MLVAGVWAGSGPGGTGRCWCRPRRHRARRPGEEERGAAFPGLAAAPSPL